MADLNHLIQWVRKNGGFVSDKLTLKEIEIFGNCLCANQPIVKGEYFNTNETRYERRFSGEKIIEIPQKMFINLLSCFANIIFLDYCTK